MDLEDHDATRRAGAALGALLQAGDVVALIGDLGAGKTTLTKAAIAALGGVDEDEVTSPTFVLVREYPGRLESLHVDAYRLAGAGDLESLDLALAGEGVAFVEWADRVDGALPADRLTLTLEHTDGRRRLEVAASGPRSEALRAALLAALA
ncbi:MAG: tRNA (adenosine(37)-N6)-threonylcarbamoyltransferase complex ATPase subunit type 1 TsaE [Planctomycetota bacterium]